ncbi:DUF262 domain-containing protein [Polaribacter sp.]|uniref:DUF262 domain-containing protein n=1 Tax=Polaribacter sp. TaxID=1920175 RepID=UPI0035C7D7DD
MNFHFSTLTIKELIGLIDKEKIDLSPSYQRKDIWTRNDQESLIDSILLNYPLPNFFIYKNKTGKFEMVDGQQRARTIHRFYYNNITDSNKKSIRDINVEHFINYNLSVTELTDLKDINEIADFYVLVNKKGKHLNTPELHKAEYNNSNYLKLSEDLLDIQEFMNLNLFTEASSRRMNDRNYVEELIAYLVYGIQDKKKIIETIYKKDIDDDQLVVLKERFINITNIFDFLNKHYPIKKTRFKQKNDFYTFFNFVDKNIDQSKDIFLYQYKILLSISNYISPSEEESISLREYALNCVSQSNSKKAREYRLTFFNSILKNKNKDISQNLILSDVANYIDENNLFELGFKEIGNYYLIDIE